MLRGENKTVAAVSNGQTTRRWNSHFGRVRSTERQVARTKQIVKHGKGKRWQRILDIFINESEDYGLVDLATTLSQLAKIQTFNKDHPVLRQLLAAIAKYIDESVIDARHYSNICHSIAKLQARDHSAQRIVNHLLTVKLAKDFLNSANPQDLSNVAWALARLGRPDLLKSLLSQMSESCRTSLFEKGKTQAMANIAWACAALGLSSAELFKTIENRSDWLVANGTPQEIANTAWACATLGHRLPELFKAIENQAVWLVANGNTQEIANTAWACAKLGHKSPALFDAIEDQSAWLVANGNPQAIANTAWACATLGHTLPELFKAIEKRAVWLVANGNTQDIANTVWACAMHGHKSPTMFYAIYHPSD
jgi:hypothetical protein